MYHVARKLRWVLGKIYSQRGSGDEALQASRINDDVSQQLECLNYNVDDRDEQTKQKSTEKNMFKSENVNDENRSAIEAKRKEIKSLELALAAKEGDLFRVRPAIMRGWGNLFYWDVDSIVLPCSSLEKEWQICSVFC